MIIFAVAMSVWILGNVINEKQAVVVSYIVTQRVCK